jgi:hypothetical protein
MDFDAAEFVTNSWFLVLIAEMLLLMIIKSPSSLKFVTGNPFPVYPEAFLPSVGARLRFQKRKSSIYCFGNIRGLV